MNTGPGHGVTPENADKAGNRGWVVLGGSLIFVAGAAIVLSIASFASAFSSLPSRNWSDAFSPFVGFFSLSVTAFTAYLALRVSRRQTAQAIADKRAQGEILDEINAVAAKAAREAGSANNNTAAIREALGTAEVQKLHRPLSRERGERAIRALGAGSIEGARALWVDDNPEWVEAERRALEEAGVGTVWVPNTQFALKLLQGNVFDVVISDMGRPESDRAGYELLDAMRRGGDRVPFIVYSSSSAPEHIAQVLDHGGQGATNDPVELFEKTIEVLSH